MTGPASSGVAGLAEDTSDDMLGDASSNVISFSKRSQDGALHNATRAAPSVTSKKRKKARNSNHVEGSMSPTVLPAGSQTSMSPGADTPGKPFSDLQIALGELPAFIEGRSSHFLKRTFPKTWTVHQTLVRKTGKSGPEAGNLHPEFKTFRSFLLHMGPAPSLNHSLDRLDYLDPLYGPGIVRWATPKTQSRNRRSNVYIELNGETRTSKGWAEYFGLSDATVRQRRRRGASLDRLFEGATQNRSKLPTSSPKAAPAAGMPTATLPASSRPLTLLGWPEEVNALQYESAYTSAVDAMGVGPSRQFTRAFFAAWVLGSCVLRSHKLVTARFPHLTYARDQFTPDELHELDAQANGDPEVQSLRQGNAALASAMTALEHESKMLSGDCGASFLPRRENQLNALHVRMRELWKRNPAYSPDEARKKMTPPPRPRFERS